MTLHLVPDTPAASTPKDQALEQAFGVMSGALLAASTRLQAHGDRDGVRAVLDAVDRSHQIVRDALDAE